MNKPINVVVAINPNKPTTVFPGTDPELGDIELIFDTDTPEEKARKEKEDEEKIKELTPPIDNEDK